MPIGVFSANLRDPKIKKPKPVRPEPEPQPVVQPAPQPVPQPAPQPAPQPIPQPEFGAFQNGGADTLRIALVTRSKKLAEEYLSGMNMNMTQVQVCGLTMYSGDNSTISFMTGIKGSLERAFFNRPGQWDYAQESDQNRAYTFRLCPPAQMQMPLALYICPVYPEQLAGAGAIDAVWILLDGHFMSNQPDAYECAVRNLLPNLTAGNIPVCLLMSQIEGAACYEERMGALSYPRQVGLGLTGVCTSLFGSALKRSIGAFPVQIYGGLEYSHSDDRGLPVMKFSASRGFQPVGCELPALYTVMWVCGQRGINYFDRSLNGGFVQAYRQYMQYRYGSAKWTPMMVGGDTQQ